MIGTPRSLWPERPIAKGTEVVSTNSMYAIPLDLLEFLSEMILTSRTFKEEQKELEVSIQIQSRIGYWGRTINAQTLTFPTAEKNSSRSRGRILAASCMQNTVRASLSSGVRLSMGCLIAKDKNKQWITIISKEVEGNVIIKAEINLPYRAFVFLERTAASRPSTAEREFLWILLERLSMSESYTEQATTHTQQK